MDHTHEKPAIVVIKRSNRDKNCNVFSGLISALNSLGIPIILFKNDYNYGIMNAKLQSVSNYILKKLSFTKRKHRTRALILHGIRLCFYVMYPMRWRYISASASEAIDQQAQNLRKFILKIKQKNVITLSHSAGGIISTKISDDHAITKHICLGYPFKKPKNSHEPHRTQHLQQIKKPCLIIQGKQDCYSPENITHLYPLSPHITIRFIEGEHDYANLSIEAYADILREIKGFIFN